MEEVSALTVKLGIVEVRSVVARHSWVSKDRWRFWRERYGEIAQPPDVDEDARMLALTEDGGDRL